MTKEELNEKMKEANDIILNWKKISGEIKSLPEAIYEALEANREAIIKYIEENK